METPPVDASPFDLLRLLKGAPLTFLHALCLAGAPVQARWLCEATGYSAGTVTQALTWGTEGGTPGVGARGRPPTVGAGLGCALGGFYRQTSGVEIHKPAPTWNFDDLFHPGFLGNFPGQFIPVIQRLDGSGNLGPLLGFFWQGGQVLR